MDEAIGASNSTAIRCLKGYFHNIESYTSFLEARINVMQRLSRADSGQMVGAVLSQCGDNLRSIFGRAEQYQRLSPGDLGETTTFVNTTCMFKSVGDFRQEMMPNLLAAIRSDQESLSALKE